MGKRRSERGSLEDVLGLESSPQINDFHQREQSVKTCQRQVYKRCIKHLWPSLSLCRRFYEVPIKLFMKHATQFLKEPEKCYDEYPWKYGEVQIHKKFFPERIGDIIKCTYVKGFKCTHFQRIVLQKKISFRWNANKKKSVKIKIPLNPQNLKHSKHRLKPTNIPLLTPYLWDHDIQRTENILSNSTEISCLRDLYSVNYILEPITSVQVSYEDPYCNALAERKVLGIKGVNFLVVSRSYFSSKQLAKKLAFEMNCVFLDPMQMMEHYYHSTNKGFYIPSKIKGLYWEYFIDKLIECQLLNKALKTKKTVAQTKRDKSELPEENIFIQSVEEFRSQDYSSTYDSSLSLNQVGQTNKQKMYVPLLLKTDFTHRDNFSAVESDIAFQETEKDNIDYQNQQEINVEDSKQCYGKLSYKNSLSPEESYIGEDDTHIMEYDNSSEHMNSCSVLKYIDEKPSKKLDPEEIIKLKKYKLITEKKLPKRALRILQMAILRKNIDICEDVWSSFINENVNNNTCYRNGYALIYYPLPFKKCESIVDYWKIIFQSSNPPDVVVYGHCPEDEVKVLLKGLRINPFLHSEIYHFDMLYHLHNCCDIYASTNLIELEEITSYIRSSFGDMDIPLSDSMVIEYYELIRRSFILRKISNHQTMPSRKILPGIYEGEAELLREDWLDEDVVLTSTVRNCNNVKGAFLPLETYVKVPECVIQYNAQGNVLFNFDAFFINLFVKTYHTPCVLKTDVRTPINYQYSIIKRWFDYSGLYSKPRPKHGNIGKLSIMCELIGRAREKEKLESEFSQELKTKYTSLLPKSLIENEEEEFGEEELNFEKRTLYNMEEAEEGLFKPEPLLLAQTTTGTSSEFGVERLKEEDEFNFLRNDWGDNISSVADEYELSLRDDIEFYKTYQCYFSSWNDRCPVAHYYYKCRRGLYEYAVRLHDKVYFLSSKEALKAFINDPAKYLLPMLPDSQCQVLILGESKSGKTYIAEAIAKFFGAYVINFKTLVEFAKEEQKKRYIQFINKELTSLIELVILEDISKVYTDKILKCVDWLEKAYQLVLFRSEFYKPLMWDVYLPETYNEADDFIFTIAEHYPNDSNYLQIERLLCKSNMKTIVIDIFLKACEKLSDYTMTQPYFLRNSLDTTVYFDSLLDVLLRKHFKKMGLLDIFGSYDTCEMYASKPCRLLERLPPELLPGEDDLRMSSVGDWEKPITYYRDKFLINNIALAAKEKIDALGSLIISLEDQSKMKGQLSYGGWIIDDFPNDTKLLKALDNAGLFPRNVIFLDEPNLLYGKNMTHHALKEARLVDIEKNLSCYISPILRHEVLPICPSNLNIEKEVVSVCSKNVLGDSKERSLQLARVQALHTISREATLLNTDGTDETLSIENWPGDAGIRNTSCRLFLYDSFRDDNKYDKLKESALQAIKFLDVMEIVYEKLERTFVKPLESLGLLHSSIVGTYFPFLYFSNIFMNFSQVKLRIFKLMNCLYTILKEDTFAHLSLEFVPFMFMDKKNIEDSPRRIMRKQKGFSYLYHLAFALEVAMLLDYPTNSNALHDIYLKIANMGYSTNIVNVFDAHGKSSQVVCDSSPKSSNQPVTPFPACTNYNFLHLNLLSPYFLDKMFNKEVKSSPIHIEQPSISIGSVNGSEKPSNIVTCIEKSESLLNLIEKLNKAALEQQNVKNKSFWKLQKLAVNALKSVLELDISCFIQPNKSKYGFLLCFPRSVSFLNEEERMYDIFLVSNKVISDRQTIYDGACNFNDLLILLYDDFWKDWYFDHTEDYICYFKHFFWNSPNNMLNSDELEKINSTFYKEEKIKRETLCILKKICFIQAEINSLKAVNKCFLSYDEEALLNYFIWLRDNFMKKHQTSFGILGFPGYGKINLPKSSNFPDWIPLFSDTYLKFNTSKMGSNNKAYKLFNEKRAHNIRRNFLSHNEKNEIDSKKNDFYLKNIDCSGSPENGKNNKSQESNLAHVDTTNDTYYSSLFEGNLPRYDENYIHVSEPWPFRSNWRNWPKFLGLYDSYLWNQLCKIPTGSYKFEPTSCSVKKKVIEKPVKRISVDEYVEYKTFNHLQWSWTNDKPLLLNESNTVLKYGQLEDDNPMNELLTKSEVIREYKSRFFPLSDEDYDSSISYSPEKQFKSSLDFVSPWESAAGINDSKPKVAKTYKKNWNIETKSDFKEDTISSLQKDGRKSSFAKEREKSILNRENEKFKEVIRLKTSIHDTSNATKISWMSLDEYGPYKILYSILDLIKGPKNSAVITNNLLVEEISDSEVELGGEEHAPFGEEVPAEEIEVEKVDKEKLCIVSLADGYIKKGSESFSASLRGQVYYFCSHECMVRFRWSPEKFVNITKPFQNLTPFNIFYSELPGGLGKHLCSVLSYFFGLELCCLDDYALQRFGPISNVLNDIKSFVLINDLSSETIMEWDNIVNLKSDLLKYYIMFQKSLPRLQSTIDIWKKSRNLCLYDFPHHQENFFETIKESVIPDIILKSSSESLKLLAEFQSCDALDNYVNLLLCDRLNITRNYTKDCTLWAKVWKSRFARALKFLQQEDKEGNVTKQQLSLINLYKKFQMGQKQLKVLNAGNQSIWSDDSISFNDTKRKKKKNEKIVDLNFSTNEPGENLRRYEEKSKTSHSNVFTTETSIFNKPVVDKLTSAIVQKLNLNKKKPSKLERLNTKILISEFLWRKTLRMCKGDEEPPVTSSQLQSAFRTLKDLLEIQKSEVLRIMNNARSNVRLIEFIDDEEENIKQEVMSFDSVGFDDCDNLPDLNKDLSDENILRLLAISLKHTNNTNPMPIPDLHKIYANVNTEEIYKLLLIFLKSFQKASLECERRVDGVQYSFVDTTDNGIVDIIQSIRASRKLSRNFECVTDIERNDVEKLLESGFYFLSSYGRQCPVQMQKECIYPGRKILYDSSNCYPVAHRRFIYFLESHRAVDIFKNNPLDYINKAEHNPIIPIRIVLFAPVTQRTMKVVKALVKEYSLTHITVSQAIEYYIRMAPWTRTGQKLKWLLSYVIGLSYPNALPISLIWEAVESMIAAPKTATHGFIITGLKPEVDLFHQWELSKFKPHIIFYITVADKPLFFCYQVQKMKKVLQNITKKEAKREIITKYCLQASSGFMRSESNLWSRSSHHAYIKYLQTFFYNVHSFLYEAGFYETYYKMSSYILDVIRTLKVLYNAVYKEMHVPIPVGNLFSKQECLQAASNYCNHNCPVCICSNLRVNKRNIKFNKNSLFFCNGKPVWICSKHKYSFLAKDFPDISCYVDLNYQAGSEKDINKTKEVEFGAFCPVCYWINKPYEEQRYQCGRTKFISTYRNKLFKLCSSYCYKEFSSGFILYSFPEKFVDARLKYAVTPLKNYPFDTSFWDSTAMKKLTSISIMGKCTKCLLFHRLMRLAILLGVHYPGWTKREARIFFIYVLTQCYLSANKSAQLWRMVLFDFLRLSGTSRRILKQFFATRGKDMPELIELLIARM